MTTEKHIDALDGLRAIAVLLVVFRHTVHLLQQSGLVEGLEPYSAYLVPFLNGWIGVDLFFVLSGFLITRALLGADRSNLKRYAGKRILRVVPAYYVVLMLCVIGFFPSYNISSPDLNFSILYHALFLQDYLKPDINVVFWSLGVEIKFYILAPLLIGGLLFLYSKKYYRPLIGVLLALACLSIAWRYFTFFSLYDGGIETVTYYEFFRSFRAPFHACFEPLCMGVIAAFLEKMSRDKVLTLSVRLAHRIFWSGFAMMLLVLCSHNMMAHINLWDITFQPTFIAFSMGLMALGAVFSGAPSWMGAHIFKFYARISYSLYLVHWPLWPVSFIAAQFLFPNMDALPFLILFAGLYLAISTACAAILYYSVERPFLRIKAKASKT